LNRKGEAMDFQLAVYDNEAAPGPDGFAGTFDGG
jgi:hypothetical protein